MVSQEIAKFWASRAQLNDSTGYYDINHVMGSDEDHGDINNNVLTNVIAGYALYFGQWVNKFSVISPAIKLKP